MALRCNIALDDRFIPSTILTATSAVCRYFRFPILGLSPIPNTWVSLPTSFFASLQRPHSFWPNGRLCPLGAFCHYSPSHHDFPPFSSGLSLVWLTFPASPVAYFDFFRF